MPAVSRTMITMALLGALAAPAAPGPPTAVAAAGPEMIAPVVTAAAGQPVQQEVRVLWAVGRPSSRGTRGAYRYDRALVPSRAWVRLVSVSALGVTRTTLEARGLRPGRVYGTHLHARGCGADPMAAGDHFQWRRGGKFDPRFANPRNEVWLDLRTNRAGRGTVRARNPWTYGSRLPGSVVLHAQPTRHDHTRPGDAGARVACLTLSGG